MTADALQGVAEAANTPTLTTATIASAAAKPARARLTVFIRVRPFELAAPSKRRGDRPAKAVVCRPLSVYWKKPAAAYT